MKSHLKPETEPGRLVRLSLRANFSWTFAGNIIYAGTQWGLLMLLTKLFTPAEFGQYALALSIVTPIFIGSAMQLRAVQATDVKHTAPFSDYLALRLLTNLLALLCVVAITVIGLVPAHHFGLTLLLGLNQAVLLVLDIYHGARQKRERMDLVAISQVRVGLTSLAIAAIVGVLTHDIVLVVIGMLLARTLCILTFDIWGMRAAEALEGVTRSGPALGKAFHGPQLLTLTRTALPLGAVMLLISLYSNLPRYFLASHGEATVGFFAAVFSLVALQDMVTSALGGSATPRLSRYYVTDPRAFVRLQLQVAAIFFSLGIAGLLVAVPFSTQILTLVFRPEYGQFADVLVWLLIAKAVLNLKSALGYGMTAARIFQHQVWIEGLAITSLGLLAWLLVPTWAGLGAAWAMVGSALVSLTVSSVILIRAVRNRSAHG